MFLKELKSTPDVVRITEEIRGWRGRPLALFGLSAPARAAYIAAVRSSTGRKVLVITRDERSAARLAEDISFFTGGCEAFPARDLTFRPVESFSRQYEYRRIGVLGDLVGGRTSIVTASREAALMYTMPRGTFIENTLTIRSDGSFRRDDLIERLVNAGYIRRDMVEGAGQFAVRGDIVDLYTPDMTLPVRIEFWGDEIDRINTFDLASQRRVEQIEKVHISPVKEVLFTTSEGALQSIHRYRKMLTGRTRSGYDRASEREVLILEGGEIPRSMDKFISACYPNRATLLDYMDDAVIFLDDWARVKENYSRAMSLHRQEMRRLAEEGILSKGMMEYYMGIPELVGRCTVNPCIVAEDFMRTIPDFPLSRLVSADSHQRALWNGEYKVLSEDLATLSSRGYRTLVLAGTEKSASLLASDLVSMDIDAVYVKEDTFLGKGAVAVCAGHLSAGFELPAARLCLITGQKLNSAAGRPKKKRNRDSITSLDQITRGDYIVHQNYGIGIYDGIHSVTVQGITKDYLLIRFAGSDSLYVPVTQLDLISRYTRRKDEDRVTLSKLGTDSWNKAKRRARKATEEMARDLIELYAQREKAKGFMALPDTEWQKDFESRFIYEETEDQLRSAAEIKRDMESAHPMDRLLCGDVGVGKTEVALRAAFKAVMSGKQVAILVPTTVLAWQHYNTLVRRMEAFPVNIQMLSRFRTPKQRRATVRDINTGVADIVVGTHALIQKKVRFKDLGLLIVDEEQRFGVAHKEKLVEAFHGVDVLTLSATPIPRTLSMALNGIRDMSTIEQPPIDRIPIETYVSEYDAGTVAAALRRELNRGGQCYYLHNRVETIDRAAQRVAMMCPDARIGVAHGQMDEGSLSTVWQQLINGEIDILVCTTIIETGVDVPNCNTLIVEDADRMGLAQLYQIRGRVGRSTRKAYAYFTFRRDKALNETAVKRLSAIKEFTSFGSGYRIAMRDLQIRGAGSVLGKVQSGFMTTVGYDLYIKLLNQAISLMKGETPKTRKSDCVIDISVDAYIPEDYIEAAVNRIEAYKRIAALESEKDVEDLVDELIDRYGDVPPSVLGLMDISLMRVKAAALGISEIQQRKDGMIFFSDRFSDLDMSAFLGKIGHKVVINQTGRPYISVRVPKTGRPLDVMTDVIRLMEECRRPADA